MRRPFENTELIASKNFTRFKAASTQYIEILLDERWNFAGDFTLSVICNDVASPTLGCVIMFGKQSVADLIGFGITNGGTALQFFILKSASLIFNEAIELKSPMRSSRRITITRTGTTITVFENTRVAASFTFGTPLNLSTSSGTGHIGTNNTGDNFFLDGFVGYLIALNGKGLSRAELQHFHQTNILPASAHPFVIAHYPLNHDYGSIAYDVVEQYNYAKTTPLIPIHGTLINYSSDAVGTTNEILQTAWNNIYDAKKRGDIFLKGDQATMYAQIPGYVNINPASWSLYLEFAQALNNPTFATVFSGGSLNTEFLVGAISADNASVYYNFNNVMNMAPGHIRQISVRKLWISHDGTSIHCIINGVTQGLNVVAKIPFKFFRFFWQNADNNLWSGQGISRAIFFDRVVNARERNAVEKFMPEYRTFSNRQFDLNFGEVFLSGSDYFIRDDSANNRHAQIFNYNPTTNAPVLIDRPTTLPTLRKALRFVRANAHYLDVPNFTPTKEKGYTHIVGFALESDRDFDPGITDMIFCKRNNDNTRAKLLFGLDDTKQLMLISTEFSVAPRSLDYKSDLRKPNFVSWIIRPNSYHEFYTNGVSDPANSGLAAYLIQGYDEINEGGGGFRIGQDPGATSRQWNGYLAFFGIWKGVLSQAQQLDIINNTFGANPTPELLADCQLYLTFNEIVNDAGVYKIPDWSPQNRTVIMNNYSADEINPSHANYRLKNLDTLR